MALILAILKFIGILLLTVFGIVLFICLTVLFVPVRYMLLCRSEDAIQVEYSVSWLFRALVWRGDFSDTEGRLYIFGINVQNIKGLFLRMRKKENLERTVSVKESQIQMVDDLEQGQKPVQEKKASSRAKRKADSKRKNNFSFKQLSSIMNFIRDSQHKSGFRTVKKELLNLLRYLAPYQIRGRVHFGTGDPCTTGWILGGISMCAVTYTEGLFIVPHFEKKILKADGFLKGRLRLIYVVRLAIRGYLDEDIRKMIKSIRTLKNRF